MMASVAPYCKEQTEIVMSDCLWEQTKKVMARLQNRCYSHIKSVVRSQPHTARLQLPDHRDYRGAPRI